MCCKAKLCVIPGIAAVVFGLIIIVLIFLLIVRYKRRKRRRQNERFENNRGSNEFIYNCDDIKRNNKMNNVDASNLAQVKLTKFSLCNGKELVQWNVQISIMPFDHINESYTCTTNIIPFQNISPNTLNQRNITQPSPKPSPRPPPVPTRPASYTPSYGDSVNTLNNFDSVHNYGSAADELENVGTLPHIEVFDTNCFVSNLDLNSRTK